MRQTKTVPILLHMRLLNSFLFDFYMTFIGSSGILVYVSAVYFKGVDDGTNGENVHTQSPVQIRLI